MERSRLPPPIGFNLINETFDLGYNQTNNSSSNTNTTNDIPTDNPLPPTPNTPKTPPTIRQDEISPRATHLNEQFLRVMSNVGDEEDEDEGLLDLPLDSEFDFPIREHVFTPPNQESSEPLITNDQEVRKIVNQEGQEEDETKMDDVDFDLWETDYIPPPPSITSLEMPTLIGSLYGENNSIQTSERSKLFDTLPNYKDNFNEESRTVELVISKIPEEIVRQRHKEIESNEAKVRNDQIIAAKLRERDLLWREHQARKRVENLETKTKEKLSNEAEKLYQTKKERDEFLSRQFKKAKEDMEEFLSKQEAYLQEVHGEVTPTQVTFYYFSFISFYSLYLLTYYLLDCLIDFRI